MVVTRPVDTRRSSWPICRRRKCICATRVSPTALRLPSSHWIRRSRFACPVKRAGANPSSRPRCGEASGVPMPVQPSPRLEALSGTAKPMTNGSTSPEADPAGTATRAVAPVALARRTHFPWDTGFIRFGKSTCDRCPRFALPAASVLGSPPPPAPTAERVFRHQRALGRTREPATAALESIESTV